MDKLIELLKAYSAHRGQTMYLSLHPDGNGTIEDMFSEVDFDFINEKDLIEKINKELESK